jgi:hypothetical protein
MNDYQREQLEALAIVEEGLTRLSQSQRRELDESVADYMRFRRSVDRFLDRFFSAICTQTCYQSRTSACCSKDGIITFFADTVVNALKATPAQLDNLEWVLRRTNTGHRCVYLGQDGCLWTVRPVVCAMFICDRASTAAFDAAPEARNRWEEFRRREKRFKWPDRPVLFDRLERVFLDLGYQSTLMHLNFSPGLLRVKKQAGLLEKGFRCKAEG